MRKVCVEGAFEALRSKRGLAVDGISKCFWQGLKINKKKEKKKEIERQVQGGEEVGKPKPE